MKLKDKKRHGLMLGVFLALGGFALPSTAAEQAVDVPFWDEAAGFQASQYDPVARALRLGLTPQQLDRIIDRGLGESELCPTLKDDEVGCTSTIVAMS